MEHGHGGAGVGGDAGGEDTEKMWKYQWTMSPLLRSMVVMVMVMVMVMVTDGKRCSLMNLLIHIEDINEKMSMKYLICLCFQWLHCCRRNCKLLS